MVGTYIKPLKRPPKNPPSGKKKTVLGLRREALLTAWTDHALEEHDWYNKYAADHVTVMLHDCEECAEHIAQIKKSEDWT